VDPTQIAKRFIDGLIHRGPDDQGFYVNSSQSTILAHTRLSILDLSPTGHQPMATHDGRFHIVFNGEIYNFRELQMELKQQGVQFKSSSDTEILLHLFARSGPKMLEHLEGMFAFAIWDEVKRELFLARDPLGIKPLYFWHAGGQFAFSSEFRTLLSIDLAEKRLDLHGVGRYLRWGSVQEPDTLVEGVRQLQAGNYLLFKNCSIEQQQFWTLAFSNQILDGSEAKILIRERLEDSIERHLVSDVPVGLFLSGGIDSTAIAALASKIAHQPLKTFCISFDEADFNEGSVSERTARHFGTDHHDWRLKPEEGRQLFHEFLESSDLPSNDGLNTYCVAKFARQQGLKVVMSGLGGDELFGGYPSFNSVPKLLAIRRRLGLVSRPVGQFLERVTRPYRLSFAKRLPTRRFSEFLAGNGTQIEAYWAMRGFFSTREAEDTIEDLIGRRPATPIPWLSVIDPNIPNVEDAVGAHEITRYMRNQLLRDSDVMSMANGLELRVPFVDRKFIDAVNSIGSPIRYQANKRLLLDAVPEIPTWVWQKKKLGFRFPFEKWMQGEWSREFDALENLTRVRLFSWYRKWIVFVLKQFIDRHGLT